MKTILLLIALSLSVMAQQQQYSVLYCQDVKLLVTKDSMKLIVKGPNGNKLPTRYAGQTENVYVYVGANNLKVAVAQDLGHVMIVDSNSEYTFTCRN